MKQAMKGQVDDFLAKLFEVSKFNPETVSGDNRNSFHSEVRLARD